MNDEKRETEEQHARSCMQLRIAAAGQLATSTMALANVEMIVKDLLAGKEFSKTKLKKLKSYTNKVRALLVVNDHYLNNCAIDPRRIQSISNSIADACGDKKVQAAARKNDQAGVVEAFSNVMIKVAEEKLGPPNVIFTEQAMQAFSTMPKEMMDRFTDMLGNVNVVSIAELQENNPDIAKHISDFLESQLGEEPKFVDPKDLN